jgi:hypothetical protein
MGLAAATGKGQLPFPRCADGDAAVTVQLLKCAEEVEQMSLRDYLFEDFDDDLEDDLDDDVRYLADVLRQTLHDDYADASDVEVHGALSNVLNTMSPAESWNFTRALNQIGSSASQLVSDPAFGAVVSKALPVAGAALGTAIGGPAGTALGSQLGTVAAGALPSRPTPRPSAPAIGAPSTPAPPVPPPPAASGSVAAAQGLVLTQQPQVLQSLLSAALGQHGRPEVGGIPVAQVLGMLSQIVGQAAADADELMYLDQYGEDADGLSAGSAMDSDRSLYTGLLDADNLDLTEALG